MGRREGTLGETRRDGRLQLGEFDDLDLGGRTRRRLPCFARGADGAGHCSLGFLLGGGLDVLFLNPATRAGPLHTAQVDAEFLGETPSDGGDALPLAILLLDRPANDVERGLRGRAGLPSVVRSAVRVRFSARIGRRLGGGGHGFLGLRDVRLSLCRLWLWSVGGDRLRALGGLGGLGLALRGGRLRRRRCRAAVADLGNHRANRCAFAFRNEDLAQLARGVGFDLDVRFVALDLDQWLAFLDLVALFLQPAQDLAGLHGVRQPRHLDASHQFFPSSALAVTITSALPGKAIFSRRLLYGAGTSAAPIRATGASR